MADLPVRIFTISTCIHCRALKKMLEAHEIAYEFTDVDLMPKEEREAFLAAIIDYNEKKTFPVVIIGNKAIIGFQEQIIRKELGIE
ncbi:MAG TPA: glutaredoxin family protein [Desulfobulbaceae bacterium]|nr:glutaredoxin family protein [Desulfobulbaceae bacterium]